MNKKSSLKKTGSLSSNLEYWMTNLPQKLRSVPIIYLAIPGSHDSFTKDITKNSELSPDAETLLQRLQFLGPVLKYFMANWSRTQAFSITDQLKHGIRYFDLRISTKVGTDEFFFVHGLYSSKVRQVLEDLELFLEQHPQEIVILDCQHFYNLSQEDHERLMHMLDQIFGHKLMPFCEHMEHLTLEYMTTQFRYQVICIYRSDAARYGQPLLWPSVSFPTPWPNTDSISHLIDKLDGGISTRPDNTGYISQFVLTPSSWFVVKHLFSTLKEKCAIHLEKAKYNWLDQQEPGINGVNIVIADFVDLQDCLYPKEVIDLNERLLNGNSAYIKIPIPITPVDVK